MLIGYVKGEYIGESRDLSQIIKHVSPYIDKADVVLNEYSPKAAPL